MQPNLHARFITDNQYNCSYLCNVKTGIIEKQLQWHIKNNYQRQSISTNDDDISSASLDNIVQLQLNSFMQLEYYNQSNIRFAFKCKNEFFQFQLGVDSSTQSSLFMDSTATTTSRIPMKTSTRVNDLEIQITRSSPINPNDMSNDLKKQQVSSQKTLDRKINLKQLPMMEELILLRKRIKTVCNRWLKHYRKILGKTLVKLKTTKEEKSLVHTTIL